MTFAKFTDVGNREINEDYIGIKEKENGLCCVLCDGLGGHGRGEEASSFVTDKILELYESDENFTEHIGDAFDTVQKELLEEQKKRHAKFEMKTTATVLVIEGEKIRWGHIGDSRIYYFRKNRYKKRTLDHSVPQMLVLAREIKEKDIRNHPDRNKLLRVMGIEWGYSKYEISQEEKKREGLAFLLCSDGFWELIDEKQMVLTLKSSNDAEEWINKMAEIVKASGEGKNMDNYSAITLML